MAKPSLEIEEVRHRGVDANYVGRRAAEDLVHQSYQATTAVARAAGYGRFIPPDNIVYPVARRYNNFIERNVIPHLERAARYIEDNY